MKLRKRIGKKGTTYSLDYYFGGKRHVESLGRIKKREAQSKMAERIKQIDDGIYSMVREYKKVLFFDVCDDYLRWESGNDKPSFKEHEQSIKKFKSYFGNLPLYSITRKGVEDYMLWRIKQPKPGGGTISKSTVNNEVSCLRRVINKAIEWEMAGKNPASRIQMFKIEEKERRGLSKDELERLIECSCEPLKPIIMIAYLTGMRRGEILTLPWRNVRFDSDLIILEHTKGGKYGKIDMGTDTKEILWMLKERQLKENLNGEYVFANKKGKPLDAAVRHWFEKAREKAEIKCSFHSLRHTSATDMLKNNKNVVVVQKVLRHSTLSMTLKYAHVTPDLTKDALESLSGKEVVKKWLNKAKAPDSLNGVPSKHIEK
jgi:integrase